LHEKLFRHEICTLSFTMVCTSIASVKRSGARENTKHFANFRNVLLRTWGARGGPHVQDYSVSSSDSALGPVQCPCSGSPRGRRGHGYRCSPQPACAQCLRLQLQSPGEWAPC